MKKDVKHTFRDDAEPTFGTGAVYLPMWLTGLLALLLYWGCYHLDEYGGNFNPLVHAPFQSTNELANVLPKGDDGGFAMGKQLYEIPYCAPCHQPNGQGGALAPPLVDSEWVLTPNPERAIRIVQTGLTGPIKVKGQDYNMTMPPIGAAMSDEELAAVITYIRNAWGNSAPKVTAAQVKEVRARLGDRTDPHTGEELMQVPAE